MKKLIYLSLAMALLTACKPKDPKAELADLKKQQADLTAKIQDLEAKVGKKDSVKTTDVSTVLVKDGQFTNFVQIQGKIDAQDNITAYPQVQGTITAIYVKAGDHVSKGQIMVQLDNSVMKQNIAQGEAQLSLLKTLFDRQKNLWDQKIGTEVQYLQAKTNLEAGEKQLAGVKQQSDMYTIKSPISGTVDQMDLKLGQVGVPGSTGIRVVNTDVLKVKADVPESYSGTISTGKEVKIVVPDANDSLVTKVSFAAKAIDPTSRSFAVEVKLPQRATLKPNMTVILKIADYSKSSAIVIPIKAIQRSEAGDYVFINKGGIAKRVTITSGANYGGNIEIVKGLSVGDQVIIDGATDIEDGDQVKVLKSAN